MQFLTGFALYKFSLLLWYSCSLSLPSVVRKVLGDVRYFSEDRFGVMMEVKCLGTFAGLLCVAEPVWMRFCYQFVLICLMSKRSPKCWVCSGALSHCALTESSVGAKLLLLGCVEAPLLRSRQTNGFASEYRNPLKANSFKMKSAKVLDYPFCTLLFPFRFYQFRQI